MKRTNSVSKNPALPKHKALTALLVCVLMLSLPTSAAPPAIEIQGKVVRVVDGDTLVFLSAAGKQMTLRLAGIDAPEKSMPYGDLATKTLIQLVATGEITVHATKTDRYGRTIATVFSQAGDVNLALIKKGLAWHYKRYAHEQSSSDAETYARSESAARESRVGLWQDARPVPPWLYRKCHKPSLGCSSAGTHSDGQLPANVEIRQINSPVRP